MPDLTSSSPVSPARPAPTASVRPMFIGWLAILVCSLLLYDALLYASLRAEIRDNARASASVAAASLKSNLTMGVRFGKNLRTFRGIDRFLETAGKAANRPLAVFDATGALLHTWRFFPSLPELPACSGDNQELLVETATGSALLLPVLDRNNVIAGFVGAWIDHAALENELNAMFKAQMLRQLGIAGAGALLLILCLFLWRGPSTEARFRRLGFGLFIAVMFCNGVLAVQAVSQHYTQGLRNNAAHTGQILTEALNRLLLVGVSLDKTTELDAYLAGTAAIHDNTISLDILDPGQRRFASSLPAGGTEPEFLPDPLVFNLLEDSGAFAFSGEPLEKGWTLRVSLLREPWMAKLINAGLDILTLVVIALIFMVEMFLLLSRCLNARVHGQLTSYAYRSSLFRPLMFVFVLAMDMSVSFIPLRMAELTAPGALSRDVLLGLPISAEMGMTGLSVLVAGAWMKRRGARAPLMTGIACMTLGYLGSMLAQAPWQFIAARAVVGLGYGLSLLTAQAYTVKDGRLADMFAGVYAGSLCGSALGAMLAERLGYGPVFALSACILACLFFVPLKTLRGDKVHDTAPDADAKPAARLTFSDIRRLLADRRFMAFILLALLPSALLCVGFLNYFLPVFLKEADVAQSNIGRVYMLNCLIVIYSGPPLTALVQKSACRAGLLCVAGLLAALSAFSFTLLPPLPAAIAGSVLLGLATGLNIPAQSEFLLDLDIARAIGVDQAMSLLDALQRVGQVIGPLCVGAALAVMNVEDAAFWASLGLAAVSLLLPLLAGPGRQRQALGSRAPKP